MERALEGSSGAEGAREGALDGKVAMVPARREEWRGHRWLGQVPFYSGRGARAIDEHQDKLGALLAGTGVAGEVQTW